MNRFACDSLNMTTDEFMIDLRQQLVLAARRLRAPRNERDARGAVGSRPGIRPTEGRSAGS